MSESNFEAVEIAREYYNSEDADLFYSTIWGGEDIHIGIYPREDDPISEASLRTQKKMIEHTGEPTPEQKVIDLGSGYGGSARYMADQYGCQVVALNLSEVENRRARELNRKQGLDNLIEVVDGNFEELPYDESVFDLVWSQDSFLHSPARSQVISEAARILKPGGHFVFTDPMQADNCPEGVLQPILDRIHLESMASPSFYRKTAKNAGLKEIDFEELTIHMKRHYSAVLRETNENEEELRTKVSEEYINNMKKGLQHWIDGAGNGYLCWGIFHFIKE